MSRINISDQDRWSRSEIDPTALTESTLSSGAAMFSIGTLPPTKKTYENNVYDNRRSTFSSAKSYAPVQYPLGSDSQQHKEEGLFHQKSKLIFDDRQNQEWADEQQVGSSWFKKDLPYKSVSTCTISDKKNTNSPHHSFLFGGEEEMRGPRYESSCNFASSKLLEEQVSSSAELQDPPLYITTIDNSKIHDDVKSQNHISAYPLIFTRHHDRRAHYQKRDLERSQSESLNIERLESLDYSLSNIYQSSLPDIGTSFRDIFNEDVEERKAVSDIYDQYPRRRIQKRRSMDFSNEVGSDRTGIVSSNFRRKKLHQKNASAPVSLSTSTHEITTTTTFTTAEECISTEKAYSAPISYSSCYPSRHKFYDSRFLQAMTNDFQQHSNSHAKSTKEISKSSSNPLCKPSLVTSSSQGAGTSLEKSTELSISCRTLPSCQERIHPPKSIESEKACSAPIEDYTMLKSRRESFYDSTFLNQFPSYETKYIEEEIRLSSDLSPPEEVEEAKPELSPPEEEEEAKPFLKAKSRSKVQDDPSMLLYGIDDENATQFSYFIFSQIEVCSFIESDNKGKRFGMHELGRKGMACKFCQGKSSHNGIKAGRGGRYFPKTLKTMTDTAKTLMSVANHLKQCKNAPKSVKKEIIKLEKTHKQEQSVKPRGSHSSFCTQMWERLHGPSTNLKKKNRK